MVPSAIQTLRRIPNGSNEHCYVPIQRDMVDRETIQQRQRERAEALADLAQVKHQLAEAARRLAEREQRADERESSIAEREEGLATSVSELAARLAELEAREKRVARDEERQRVAAERLERHAADVAVREQALARLGQSLLARRDGERREVPEPPPAAVAFEEGLGALSAAARSKRG